ncbi:MAG: SpoIIE family protein phosphatase [Spirochaetes bacterium]|nr:SpoIIE family protein phosphatase [Spirochaetota bacterium]
MKRFLAGVILLFAALFPYWAFGFWDYPKPVAENKEGVRFSQVKCVEAGDETVVFAVALHDAFADIVAFRTKDWRDFEGPSACVSGIEIEEGFVPHYDVGAVEGSIALVWNTLSGDIGFQRSKDKARTWEEGGTISIEETFSFDPTLELAGGRVFLFYHTESEGRRIDFFYVTASSVKGDGGWTMTAPKKIAHGFAGSYFPMVRARDGSFYVVWQSRPFSGGGVPVFDIYLCVSKDGGASWSEPKNLTEDLLAENVRPHILTNDGGFTLFWESDRDGAWGVYERDYDPGGVPRSAPVKVNGSLFNAIDAVPLQDDGEVWVFFVDERDGRYKVYLSTREDDRVREEGPISGPVSGYLPVRIKDELYVLTESEDGIGYIGPDREVDTVRVASYKTRYIGKEGTLVSWEAPDDSSGIEGFSYLFDTQSGVVPEIINLDAEQRSLHISPEEEGEYYLHLRAADRAGNLSETVTIPVICDFTPPEAPKLASLDLDDEGFYEGNSPVFSWEAEREDVAGFNYTLSRKKADIKESVIRTTKKRVKFGNVDGGRWWFNISAVDRAGNTSETARVEINLRPLPKEPAVEPQKEYPVWVLSRYSFSAHPFLNITLIVLLCGLLCTSGVIFFDMFVRYLSLREEKAMGGIREQDRGGRRFGLRFKFSVLIGALVLLVTVGISTILSVVGIEQEKRALAGQMFDKAVLSLENLTNVAREGMLNNDELLLLSVVSKTMENRDIRHSIILDQQRRVVAHSDFEQVGTLLSDDFTLQAVASESMLVEPAFSEDDLHEVYELSSPVVFSNRRIGTVRIGYSTDSIFAAIDEFRMKSILNTIIITIVTIVVGIVGAILLATVTIKPIKALARGVDIIGSGDLEHKIQVKTRDEIGMLAVEFNRMTGRLLQYQRQIENQAKLEEQLEIARRIQQDLIPSVGIDTDRISIDGFYKAASGVGGDYYDFIEVDGGRYGLIMSDVAGKGVPASLMMIMIRSIFKSLIGSGVSDPARVATLMNRTLAADISSDRFATLLFCLFDIKKRTLRYTNAGYGPLMVFSKKKKRCSLIHAPEGSFPIGVLSEAEYEEEKPVRLAAGDAVILCTDGIHEARNGKDSEYGIDRLMDIVPTVADRGAKEMAGLIVDDVLGFVKGAEQYDDMTLMILKVK